MTYVIPVFTINDTTCTATYTLKFSNGTALNSAFVSFAASTRTMTVSTSNFSLMGSYTMLYSATIDGFTAQVNTTTFTLVLSYCNMTDITTKPIANQTVNAYPLT